MPRRYNRDVGARRYHDYRKENLIAIIQNYKNGLSLRKCEERHGVPCRGIQKSVRASMFLHIVRLELFCSISHFKCWEKVVDYFLKV